LPTVFAPTVEKSPFRVVALALPWPSSPVRRDGRDARGRTSRSLKERAMSHAPGLPWTFDRAAALHLVDGDDALLDEVLTLFVVNGPSWLRAVEGAIYAGNPAALSESAHTLKGAAGYLAAPHFITAAQELESLGRDGHIHTARALWPRFAAMAADLLSALRMAQAGTYR
jgi:HPt (histidine-containing phosphotransfer) domain-containing protein